MTDARYRRTPRELGTLAAAVATVGLLASPHTLLAQEDETPTVNNGNITFNLGADVVSEYWFRGIGQENEGLILQPYFDVSVALVPEGDVTVGFFAGTWNSFHNDNGVDDDIWYESDLFAGFSFGLPGGVALDVAYINLYNPDGSQSFAEEIDVILGYDDTELMESMGVPFALSPYALLAFEFSGGSDNGADEGTYLELGIEPSFAIVESVDYPVTLAIPVTLGLGLDNYYEDGAGNDDTFGFLDVGAVVSMPLGFMPAEYGAWSVSAGVHYILLGDSAQNISAAFGTGDDSSSVYGTFGISMSY